MIGLLAGAGMAGLLGSPHCVGMCGAFATASEGRVAEGAAWQVGRLFAYAGLGAAAGALGAAVPLPGPAAGVAAVLLLGWFSLRLAGVAPALPVRLPFPTRVAGLLLGKRGWMARFGFGALSALLPCGLLWSALAVAAASAGAMSGAAAMAAFWLGTVPALAAASRGLRAVAGARPWARRALAAAVFAAGVWSIGLRTGLPGKAAVEPGAAPACHHAM